MSFAWDPRQLFNPLARHWKHEAWKQWQTFWHLGLDLAFVFHTQQLTGGYNHWHTTCSRGLWGGQRPCPDLEVQKGRQLGDQIFWRQGKPENYCKLATHFLVLLNSNNLNCGCVCYFCKASASLDFLSSLLALTLQTMLGPPDGQSVWRLKRGPREHNRRGLESWFFYVKIMALDRTLKLSEFQLPH